MTRKTKLGQAMEVNTTHPEYTLDRRNEWRLMRDTWAGETRIKRRGEEFQYLPKPRSWVLSDKDGGKARYDAYIARAIFPEWVSTAIRQFDGIIHADNWQFELPAGLEYLHESATPDGLTLDEFSRRITRELLLTGRYGVLTDAPASGGDPYLAGYAAETIINWESDSSFFVLEERVSVREGFVWKEVIRSRVLDIVDGKYQQQEFDDGVLVDTYMPRARGGKTIDFVPFVVGGAMDFDLTPDVPPLIGVARNALRYYQLTADYAAALYFAYQDTLIIIDGELPLADDGEGRQAPLFGAGLVMQIQSSQGGQKADVKFVAPNGTAIAAHVEAMDRAKEDARQAGAALFSNAKEGGGQESGEARRLRFFAATASLRSIATASAAILERALRNVAMMKGLDPETVIVTPPKNLLEGDIDPQMIAALTAIWQSGGISYQTLYEKLQSGRIASPERTADDEAGLIMAEGDAATLGPESGMLQGDSNM